MSKVAIMTDSNSGITPLEAKEQGICILPMPFIIDGKEYLDGEGLTHDMFYEMQIGGADIKTSQPSPASVTDMWDNLLKEYDEVVHIPMASGLSESCSTAKMLAQDYEGKVHVADARRILVTQRHAALDAATLAKAGKSGVEIKEYIESVCFDSCIYLAVDTMKYLKKGGRVSPAAALIGTVLNIKPVLKFVGEKIDRHAKARGTAKARGEIIAAIKNELATKFADCTHDKVHMDMAYSHDIDAHNEFQKEVEAAFPEFKGNIHVAPLSLSIATHTGPGVVAVTLTKKLG